MSEKTYELATFAGGCFWCMVKPFDELPGIQKIISGYAGGHIENPTYEQVKSGTSGHLEVVQITFDPSIFPYQKLLDLYWPQIDPTDDGGQFFDRGPSYRTTIFYHNETQKELAEKSKQTLAESGMFKNPIVTEIRSAAPFYEAEEYHQHFYKKNPEKYATERKESGREDFIKENWQKNNKNASCFLLKVRCVFIFEKSTIQLKDQSLLMSKVLSRFSLYSFSSSFHSLLIAIKHIQGFLCLIVHLMNVNKSVHILIARPPIIPIAIAINNIFPKLREVVYVM